MKEYCYICGSMLMEVYGEDTFTVVGWQCLECETSWELKDHRNVVHGIVKHCKEMKLRIDELEIKNQELRDRLRAIEEVVL